MSDVEPHYDLSTVSASWEAFDEPSFAEVEALYGSRPGIYKVVLLKEDRSAPLPIRRLVSDDESGVIYVGKADSIIQRFVQLRRAVWTAYEFRSAAGHLFIDPGPHVVGRKLSEVFLNRFRRNHLVFEIHGFSSTADMPADYTARAHEQQVIAEYIQVFGEPPPFNDQR